MSEYVTAWADDLPGMTHGEEIIRCRDCKYYASNMHECMRLGEWDDSLWFTVEQNDFCSWGEREDA